MRRNSKQNIDDLFRSGLCRSDEYYRRARDNTDQFDMSIMSQLSAFTQFMRCRFILRIS